MTFRGSRAVALLVIVVAACLVSPSPANADGHVNAPGAQEPTVAAASAGSITVNGHGWGHGRGMGQHGAMGYARDHGWTYSTILGHFYSNTVQGSTPATGEISVWVKARDAAPLVVYSADPFTVGGVTIVGTAMVRQEGGSWVLYSAPPGAACNQAWGGPRVLGLVGTPIRAISTNPAPGNDVWRMLGLCTGEGIRHYRGQLELLHSGVPRTLNVAALDSYVRGVVPREVPAGWPMEALKAQAVAARSYARSEGGENGRRFAFAKTCDDIQCQVYGGAGLNGARLEHDRTDMAVASTGGQVRRFGNGTLARTEFSSSTGGYTNGTPACSACAFAAVPDAGDAVSPHHSWTTTLSVAALEQRYQLGTYVGAYVTRRNGLGADGGRVLEVRIVGSSRTVTVTGADFRSAFGLRSDWFTLVPGLLWYVRNANAGGHEDALLPYGNRGDHPVAGDWNGDRRVGIGTFLNGMWYLRDSQAPGGPEIAVPYGNPGDIPVVGDWNNDNHDTIGTFRDGVWYLRNSGTPGPPEIVIRYGRSGDTPVVGDWNGDGADSIGTQLAGVWYLRDAQTDGPPELFYRYGNQHDTAVTGDWNADRFTTPGAVWQGVWYLRNAPRSGGPSDVPPFGFGLPGDRFLTGDFDGNGTDTPIVVRG